MKDPYRDLSELLQTSTPAEAYFSQLPAWIQERAVAQGHSICSEHDLRQFVRRCQQEVL